MSIERTTAVELHGAQLSRNELLGRYHAYRRRQARGLLGMLPREAVRPLYRRALGAGPVEESTSDPMQTLLAYCEGMLPLPPFEVWREDVRCNPEAHLRDVDASADAPSADAPATIATRWLAIGGRTWAAHLRSFRDGDTWRGFIAFEDSESRGVHRTTLVFREADPTDVRGRFMGFEAPALGAFLRSALP
ncbi:MAG: hypothetical protein PVJ80_03590 [Gemmatimonadota bacterium]